MALILHRVEMLLVMLNLGASISVDLSNLTDDDSAFQSSTYQPLSDDQLDDSAFQSSTYEPLAEDQLDQVDANPKDPEMLLGEVVAEEHSKDPENFAIDSTATNSLDQVDDAYSNDADDEGFDTENLMTDMVNDVVDDVVNDVTSVSFLAPEKGDAIPAFPVTFPGCSCEWNEPGYSCEGDILDPDTLSGQPCCCCGLKCLKEHRCSNDQCLLVGHDQQKEMEDEAKRIADLLNRSDVVLSGNIPAFTVDLGKGQCTNKKIIEKCTELGLTPVCDHMTYARAAKVCWTNMQHHHWSHLPHRFSMRSKGFSIPEEFDQKSMGMCFMGNYPHNWALAPSAASHVWTSQAHSVIRPLTPGTYSNAVYKGPTTPSKNVQIKEMNDCSGELGCWRTLCVKKDPCSDCGSCGNPCGACGKSNCPPVFSSASPPSPPPSDCVNGKQMSKKYQAKWPHCSNIRCFGNTKFTEVKKWCLSDPLCNGFSYTKGAGANGAPTSGGGCLKMNCSPERNGYGLRSHDYWVKGSCQSSSTGSGTAQPKCASAPPSSSHLLVSGAWPCVKTGAPCKKVQKTASNHYTRIRATWRMGMENAHIGVTCCDAKGTGSRPSCKHSVTFDQAVSHCKSVGLDLCTAEQIKAGAGEATGCRFDHGMVWTCSAR